MSSTGVTFRRLAIAATVAVLAICRAAPARGAPTGYLGRLLSDARARVDAAIAARPPRLVPPVPVPLAWKLVKLGALDLGAPLVALTGGDLDGDGAGELYAVTTRDVVAIGWIERAPRERARVALTGARTTGAPRDVVAFATVDGAELVASLSTRVAGLRVGWQGGALATAPGAPGFLVCPGEVASLAPGRNYFGDAATAWYAARCNDRLVDGDGFPLDVRARLAVTGTLDVTVARCAARGRDCQLAGRHAVAGVGVAFELADLDRDGRPEVIASGAGAPGDPDTLRVMTLGDSARPRLERALAGGGVAGIGVAAVDGDGAPEAIAAVRALGATRFELWRIE